MPHIHERYDFVVTVYIVYDAKVLLVNHPRYGKWIPVGGHVELDEDPEETLYREVKEETGLEVKVLSDKPKNYQDNTKFILTPRYINVHDANPPHKHIALIYFAKARNNHHVLSAEHTDLRWLSLEELDAPEYNLSESNKYLCQEAIRLVTAV